VKRLWGYLELVLYRALLRVLEQEKEIQELVRRVLVSRKRFKRRLVAILDMGEIDQRAYWAVQMYVPASLIQTPAGECSG
jgi:hypothetical protein